jgi:hypothetical protein
MDRIRTRRTEDPFGPEWERMQEYRDAEQRRIFDHQRNGCWGAWGQCQSCGCSKTDACVSHRTGNAWLAHQMKRVADALERSSDVSAPTPDA